MEKIYILSSFPSALDSKMPRILNVNSGFPRVEAMGKEYKSSCCPLVLAISGAFFFFYFVSVSGLILIFFTPVGGFVVHFSVPLGYHDVSRVNENNLRRIFWY